MWGWDCRWFPAASSWTCYAHNQMLSQLLCMFCTTRLHNNLVCCTCRRTGLQVSQTTSWLVARQAAGWITFGMLESVIMTAGHLHCCTHVHFLADRQSVACRALIYKLAKGLKHSQCTVTSDSCDAMQQRAQARSQRRYSATVLRCTLHTWRCQTEHSPRQVVPILPRKVAAVRDQNLILPCPVL
jgi:hypothetical protein